MSEIDRYQEPPPRVHILPGYVNLADAVSVVRAAASRRDPANVARSPSDLRRLALDTSATGLAGWKAAWHTLRQGILEGSIAALECDHRGRITVLLPEYWREIFEAPSEESDVFGLRQRERTEPSPFKDWRSPSGAGRYVIDEAELLGFVAKEFPVAPGAVAAKPARRGRKTEFDEIAIVCEAANIKLNQPGGKRIGKEKLIANLLEWYGKNYGREPSRGTVQKIVWQFWDHFDLDDE